MDLENFLSKFEVVVGGALKNHTWTKNAGNFMKWINPQSLRWWWGRGGQKSHLNKKCRKFHEMDKSIKKNFFHCLANLDLKNYLNCLADMDLENFLSKFEVVMGGGQKSHLNQKCRKFHEMDKSSKIIFSLFGWLGLRKFFVKVWGGGGGWGVSKIRLEPKLQEISWNV